MNNYGIVYGLYNSEDNRIFYIGKTKRNLEVRLKEHLKEKKNAKKNKKIKEILASNNQVIIKEITKVTLDKLHIEEWFHVITMVRDNVELTNNLSRLFRFK